MYKIIGADHREYGPCSTEEMRNWIREGRVNAQTLVQAAGSTQWQPLAAHPELAAMLVGGPVGAASITPPTIGPTTGQSASQSTPRTAEELAREDYQLDILSCMSRAWALLQRHFWPMVGISFLVIVANWIFSQTIETIFPSADTEHLKEMVSNGTLAQAHVSDFVGDRPWLSGVELLLEAPVRAVLFGGLFYYFLKLIRGESGELADAFSGFSRALGPLILLGIVKGVLTGVGLLLCLLPGIYLAVAWTFSVVLTIDRRLPFWDAMELSRKVVSRHWFTILGLVLLNALVGISGLLACCIGVFVTAPLALVSLMYAYEDIFQRPAGQVQPGLRT
jgi:hypothetical protein